MPNPSCYTCARQHGDRNCDLSPATLGTARKQVWQLRHISGICGPAAHYHRPRTPQPQAQAGPGASIVPIKHVPQPPATRNAPRPDFPAFTAADRKTLAAAPSCAGRSNPCGACSTELEHDGCPF